MNQKSEFQKSIETYALIIIMTGLFITSIASAAVITDHNFFSMLPDFSWNMINSWDDIFNK